MTESKIEFLAFDKAVRMFRNISSKSEFTWELCWLRACFDTKTKLKKEGNHADLEKIDKIIKDHDEFRHLIY